MVRARTWTSCVSNAYVTALSSLIAGIGLIAALVALLIPGSGDSGAWLAAAVIALTLLAVALVQGVGTITVRMDERDIRVSYGPWQWPSIVTSWDQVERVSAVEVKPSRWGWPSTSATRPGPGLRIERRELSDVLVMCESDGAERFARARIRAHRSTAR